MKSKFLLPALLVFIITNILSINTSYSQAGSGLLTIKGMVTDSLTNKAIAGATVVVSADKKPPAKCITKHNGEFEIQFGVSNIINVEVTHVGYKKYKSEIKYNTPDTLLDAGSLLLSPDAKVLSHVNVDAFKPVIELKAGMSIYNVQTDPMSTGKQLNEVLENLPGVSTDANGGIKVNGVSEILVMINRRTSRMNYNDLLKQMPASSIERVSVAVLLIGSL
jgi:hypothetical protein